MPSTAAYRPMTIIVAATMKNGIGVNGGLPWRLPGEMKYFARGASILLSLPVQKLIGGNSNNGGRTRAGGGERGDHGSKDVGWDSREVPAAQGPSEFNHLAPSEDRRPVSRRQRVSRVIAHRVNAVRSKNKVRARANMPRSPKRSSPFPPRIARDPSPRAPTESSSSVAPKSTRNASPLPPRPRHSSTGSC